MTAEKSDASSAAPLQARLLALNAQVLSTPSRYGHVALLLAAALMAVLLASLLATEPALPARTGAAMQAMLAIAVCWCGYAGWVLSARRPLLARHRVVAGGMAVAFTGLFAAATAALAWSTRTPGFVLAAGTGALLLALAIGVLVRARRRRRTLLALQDALQARLDRPA